MLMIFICGFLLWSGLFPRYNFNIYWYVYSQTVSYLITMAIALFIVLRHTKKLIFRFNLPFIIVIIRKSLPYALLILLMSFYFRLEPVLIERILPPDIASFQVGILPEPTDYSMQETISPTCSMLSFYHCLQQ